ncbi:ATP-dependent RecD-like DNA helicase [Cytobacillus sp. FJAT-54145]|uniref:ATP-dependent RecD-like DNA helicase n=1 Tax=Cytobacillus spartinae TaxID=3299023 RepID=A0ABW6KDA5_9BACI
MQIEGVIDYIQYPKYFKNAMEWAVLQIRTAQGKVKAVGEMMTCKRGELFLFEGDFTQSKYGKEFRFTKATRSDQGEAGALSYLSHLFGPKTAQKIIKHFKTAEESLKVFKEDSGLLTQIKGISHKTVKKAQLKHQKNKVAEELFTNLKPYGISMNMALKIFKRYGDEAMDTLRDNPYCLMKDFEGIGFDLCDLLADYFGISLDHPKRLQAGYMHAMRMSMNNGHCFQEANELKMRAEKVLTKKGNVAKAILTQTFLDMIRTNQLAMEKGDRVYLPYLLKYEKELATHIRRLRGTKKYDFSEMDAILTSFEQQEGFTLHHQQREAIKRSLTNMVSIITGPPGSGKTTIIKAILYCLEQLEGRVIQPGLCAPTGRAARRMTESTGTRAYTVHKLLDYKLDNGKWDFKHNQFNPISYELLLADEVSMLDLPLANHLFQAIPKGCRVILVGDDDQLPSVGPGQVLADLMNSGEVPFTTLKEVYRQKNGSTILERALNVSKGKIPCTANDPYFSFIHHDDQATLLDDVVEAYVKAVKEVGLDEVILLSPMRKHLFGVDEMNRVLQDVINPPALFKSEVKFGNTVFRQGDKVIQMTQNEEEGLVNGQIGYVEFYQPEDPANGEEERLLINYEGDIKLYTRDRFDELKLCYATTTHKSQGSEWKVVFLPFCAEHRFMIRRRIIYTGMTRAKDKLNLFGDIGEFKRGVHFGQEPKRLTLLKERIQGAC